MVYLGFWVEAGLKTPVHRTCCGNNLGDLADYQTDEVVGLGRHIIVHAQCSLEREPFLV